MDNDGDSAFFILLSFISFFAVCPFPYFVWDKGIILLKIIAS